MKNLVIIFLLSLFFLSACKKENATLPTPTLTEDGEIQIDEEKLDKAWDRLQKNPFGQQLMGVKTKEEFRALVVQRRKERMQNSDNSEYTDFLDSEE